MLEQYKTFQYDRLVKRCKSKLQYLKIDTYEAMKLGSNNRNMDINRNTSSIKSRQYFE